MDDINAPYKPLALTVNRRWMAAPILVAVFPAVRLTGNVTERPGRLPAWRWAPFMAEVPGQYAIPARPHMIARKVARRG